MIYLSPGNSRMKIPTFSIPAVKTCKGRTKSCEKYCYARKAEVCWKNVLPSRTRNLKETKKFGFVKGMITKVVNTTSRYIRIHESGDFYSQRYLNKWFEICESSPSRNFLAYTQMYDLDWSNKPDNMIVYWSIWHDSKDIPTDGLKAYTIDNGKGKIPIYKSKGKMCKKNKNFTCDECLWCFEGKGDVKFKIH